jgi:phosphatidylglycerol---prolipoprotein diacylglyceryl transferase
MVRRARRSGGPPENDIWNALFYALLGSIVGARLGYVLGHLSQVTDGGDDLLGVFRVWEGGISLIGGITGAVLMSLPYVLRKRMGFWRCMDLAAPGLALGIVIGRVGDLIIGDHLGKPTTFALGWRCLGSEGVT